MKLNFYFRIASCRTAFKTFELMNYPRCFIRLAILKRSAGGITIGCLASRRTIALVMFVLVGGKI